MKHVKQNNLGIGLLHEMKSCFTNRAVKNASRS